MPFNPKSEYTIVSTEVSMPIPMKSTICSDSFRPVIPKIIDQSFRSKAASHSEAKRPGNRSEATLVFLLFLRVFFFSQG